MRAYVSAGGVEIRPGERRVLVNGMPAAVGSRAFDVLLALVRHRDRVVDKAELMALAWPGVVVEENNLSVQIASLRKALGRAAIVTAPGRGYQFTLPTVESAGEAVPPASTASSASVASTTSTSSATPAAPTAPTSAASASTGARADERPVIAVLPFDDHSDGDAMGWFCDGVSEDIILRLARGSALRVISRTSSFQFRSDRKADAAAQLGCRYLLDGSIRRTAARVRVHAQLTDAPTRTTIWAERYDREIEDIVAVQDDVSAKIAGALHEAFSRADPPPVDATVYDLFLRARPKSYSPDDLRTCVQLLEVVVERAPDFLDAWGRLAYLRGFLHVYLPFGERAANARRVALESSRALTRDSESIDALAAHCFVAPPFGDFLDADRYLERLQRAPGAGDGRRYVGWFLRHTGRVRESVEATERAWRLDPLDPMSVNLMALALMASGRVDEAVPLYEALVERIPAMSFPVSSLLRARAFQQDWDAVDRLLAIARTRPLREFQDTIPFVTAKRDPTPANVDAWYATMQAHVAKTGWIDVARLVYAAHLGRIDDAYRLADSARLGPAGNADDLMGPDGYRTALLFQASMPELRNDPRFPRLAARLGLVDFWRASGKWPDCASEVPYDFVGACEAARHVAREPFAFHAGA